MRIAFSTCKFYARSYARAAFAEGGEEGKVSGRGGRLREKCASAMTGFLSADVAYRRLLVHVLRSDRSLAQSNFRRMLVTDSYVREQNAICV